MDVCLVDNNTVANRKRVVAVKTPVVEFYREVEPGG